MSCFFTQKQYKQQNVYLAEDIFSTGYVGGDDCNFFSDKSQYATYLSNYDPARSLFACIVPYTSSDYANPMDITGRLPNDRAASAGSGLHYATAPFYKHYWQFDNQNFGDGNAPHYHANANRVNTIVYQGHQSMYSVSDRTHNLVIKNTGHWGDRVYPGCGKIRNGFAKALEPVSYTNIYGGGGTSAVVGIGY